MNTKQILEIITLSLGSLLILFPWPLLRFLQGLAQINYENYRSTMAEVKKRGPSSFNEKIALQNAKIYDKIFGSRKEVYGPQTSLQRWLARLLGLLLILLGLGTFWGVISFH